MSVQGTVSQATQGAIGFDTAVPLTAKVAKAYVAQGFQFVVRYVSRTDKSRANNEKSGLGDVSEAEAKLILASGLSLMVVQHVATTGWIPTPVLGKSYGTSAAAYTKAAGLPAGLNVWLDLEDIPKGTPHEDIIGYCNEWFSQVATAGFVPGVYVGFNVWLSSDELFFDLTTQHYWRAAGNIPDISHRGYQMFQHVINAGTAHELDKNVVKADMLGGNALWLSPV
jgi:hypothetical protein